MKLLVLSDSHSNSTYLKLILSREKSADMILHLGDHADDMQSMTEYTHGKALLLCKGNCDFYSYNYSDSHLFDIDEIKILCCHGHKYNVKNGLNSLYFAGRQDNAELCLFGHTHEQYDSVYNGIRLVNPGAVCNGNYATITISGKDISVDMKTV